MLRGFLKNKFVRDSFIYTLGTLAAGFLGYVFQMLVSRNLEVAQYGEFQSLMSSSAIFGVVGSAVSYFVIKYTAVFAREGDFEGNNVFLKNVNFKLWKLAILLVAAFLLAAPFLREYLKLSNYLGLIFVGATLFVSLVAIGYVAVLSGWQMFKIASLAAVVFGLLKLLAGMIGIKLSPTSNGVVFFLFLFAVAHLLISYGIVRIKFYSKGVAANSDWKQKYFYRVNIGKSVLPIALFSLAVAIMQNIDVILVKNLTSAEVTGHYAVLNLLGRIIFWVNGAVIAVVLPAACANGMDNMRPAKKLVWSAYGLICCVGLCGTLIYFVAPNFIVSLLFGAKYLVFAKDLWLFGIIAFALSLLMLEANFSYARHDFRVSYVLTGVALLMIGSIHFYHETVRQVASGVFAAMILGFCAASVLNNCQIKKVVKREEVN